MRAWATFVVVVALLGGCADGGDRITAATRDYNLDQAACQARLEALPSYAALQGKIMPAPGGSLAAVLTNNSKPTAADRALLLDYYDNGLAPCRRGNIETAGRVNPAYIPPMVQGYSDLDAAYMALLDGRSTWGQHAQAAARIISRTDADMAAVTARFNSELRANEAQQRQAAGLALLAWTAQQNNFGQQQQAINVAYRPRITNCSYVGVALTCTTF